MSDDDKQPKPDTLGTAWEHLNAWRDKPQPEEWRERESARRKGRRTKEWWKSKPPEPK